MESEMAYIHTIYEYGCLSKAANALYIQQPAWTARGNKTGDFIV